MDRGGPSDSLLRAKELYSEGSLEPNLTATSQHDLTRKSDIIDFSAGCPDSKVRVAYCSHCGRPYFIVIGCNSRFSQVCHPCSKHYKRKTIKRFSEGLAGMKAPKLMTLTLSKHHSVEYNLERIWKLKNALFHRIVDKGYKIRSWFAVVELPNHIHIIIDTDYIPQYQLSTWWKGITGDSMIVDIRKINIARESPKKAIHYISGYLTKGINNDDIPLGILKSFHLIGSWNLLSLVGHSNPLCDCEEPGPMRLLEGVDIQAYLRSWDNTKSGPPSNQDPTRPPAVTTSTINPVSNYAM